MLRSSAVHFLQCLWCVYPLLHKVVHCTQSKIGYFSWLFPEFLHMTVHLIVKNDTGKMLHILYVKSER